MREITSHKVNGCNEALTVTVEDEPGSGGANHLYMIRGFNTKTNTSCPFTARHGSPAEHATVLFQNGPIPEVGTNGITHEALLAVLIDRLEGFQSGPFANGFNEHALNHLKAAQEVLQKRTAERVRDE